jgi:hypothetical protein
MGSVLTIVTTDGDVTGLPAHVMPPAVTTVVEIRCASLGVGAIAVPAAAAAALPGAGATRVRTTFLRTNLQSASNTSAPQAGTSVVAGHGAVGFTTP